MKQIGLPLNFKTLEIGDKVRILSKSVGGCFLPFGTWSKGNVGYVESISLRANEIRFYYLKKEEHLYAEPGAFLREDLEIVY